MSIQVNYDLLDDKCFINYLNFLIGGFYKILPISEEEPSTLYDYMSSLKMELIGNSELIERIKHDALFLSLIGSLQYLITNECDHKTLRNSVLKCINIVKKLLKKYGGELDGNSRK